jgi:hypothetical protein
MAIFEYCCDVDSNWVRERRICPFFLQMVAVELVPLSNIREPFMGKNDGRLKGWMIQHGGMS